MSDDATIASAALVQLNWRHQLRTAASLLFALVAVALCVLWVRSYWREDRIVHTVRLPHTYSSIGASTLRGVLSITLSQYPDPLIAKIGSSIRSIEVNDDEHPRGDPQFEWWSMGPDWWTGDSMACISFPIWLPAGLSGAMAALLCRPPGFNFSLRSLLFAITLVAVVLGLGVWLAS